MHSSGARGLNFNLSLHLHPYFVCKQRRLCTDSSEPLLLVFCVKPYFFRKLGKMSQNLSSAAVVMGALRVKTMQG